MATGIQSSNSKRIMVVRLIDGDIAANGAPSGAPTATPAPTIGFDLGALDWGSLIPSEATIRVRSTAGSATMTVTVKLWDYTYESGIWCPAGIGAAASKGIINGGVAIPEGPDADKIRHSEPILCLHHFDGIYAEIPTGGIGGTDTAVIVELLIPRTMRY